MAFNTGPMPHGESYEDFAELLARFYVTFLPLKTRGGADAEDFSGISAHLARMARRHDVPVPAATAKEGVSPFSTPAESLDHLNAFYHDYGLCQEGVPYAAQDSADKNALGRAILGIFHRYKALIAKFDVADGRKVAVGIECWIGRSESTLLDEVLDPKRKEA